MAHRKYVAYELQRIVTPVLEDLWGSVRRVLIHKFNGGEDLDSLRDVRDRQLYDTANKLWVQGLEALSNWPERVLRTELEKLRPAFDTAMLELVRATASEHGKVVTSVNSFDFFRRVLQYVTDWPVFGGVHYVERSETERMVGFDVAADIAAYECAVEYGRIPTPVATPTVKGTPRVTPTSEHPPHRVMSAKMIPLSPPVASEHRVEGSATMGMTPMMSQRSSAVARRQEVDDSPQYRSPLPDGLSDPIRPSGGSTTNIDNRAESNV
jgi:hypothetical protein